MRNKKIIFLSILIFMIVLGVSAVSAQDSDDAVSATDGEVSLGDPQQVQGTVSGDVDVVTENPWNTSGELNYDIPTDAKTIKSADVYVNVYSGSAKNTHGANANISIAAGNSSVTYSESLWIEEGSTDGTIYTVNNHTTKCYSDYMIHYDITESIQGLNGTPLKINVDTFKMENKSFDGRIKLIGLVLAYDDGDEDSIYYWINDTQIWTNSNTTLTFDTSSLTDVLELSLTNIALSSSDATYKFNGEFLEASESHVSGNYYQYNQWDLTDLFNSSRNAEFTAIGTPGSYGVSYKNVLSVLTAKPGVIEASVSLATERVNKGVTIAYPGTYNQITVTVNTNKNGKYTIQLLADGEVVNSTTIALTSGSKKVNIIDPTIREIDQSTAYVVGGYNNVTYTAKLLLKDEIINESSIEAAILYNGYFEKDLSYPGNDYVSFLNETISGDFVYLVSDVPYASGSANKVDNWNVSLPENSTFVKAFVYVAYASGVNDTIDLFNVTFNDVKPSAVFFSRDQANVIAVSGYGLIVYDVTDLIKEGVNTFVLNKTNSAGAYPSTLIYLYNTTGSESVKNVYITNGADLLGTYGNAAGRTLQLNTVLDVDASCIDNATIYVFGAGATEGRASIEVNGDVDDNVWNTSESNQINVYTKDITGTVSDSNNVSVVLNNSMFTALQQIIVLNKYVVASASVKVADNTKDIVYPGFANAFKVTVNTNKAGKYVVNLLADGEIVNSTEIDLIAGENTLALIDPTIRPFNSNARYINASGVYDKVSYQVQVLFDNETACDVPYEATVLYNGYLGKDTYNATSLESFYTATITGDAVILTNGSYATGTTKYALTDFNVELPENSTIVKAFMYVTYTYGKNDNINMFNVALNGNAAVPVYFTRDASNLKSDSGYGVIVYDVTDLVVAGVNVLDLNKTDSAGVYPTTLVYMYNTTGSEIIKEIYISNGADLLGTYGGLNNPIKADSVINVNSTGAKDAVAYIFANGAVDGRGTVIVNGESDNHPWNGSSQSTDLYIKNITGTINDTNAISVVFSGTSGSFTVLQQIIVLTKDAPVELIATNISASDVSVVYNKNGNLVVSLNDVNGNAIANVNVTVALNKVENVITTNETGQATFAIPYDLVPSNYVAVISFAGDDTYINSSSTANVIVKKADVKLKAKNKKFKAKTKTKKYAVKLKDNLGKPMNKVKLAMKVNGKKYKAKTNAKGKAVFKIKKLTKKGKYKAKIKFAGDNYYNKVTKKVKIVVKK